MRVDTLVALAALLAAAATPALAQNDTAMPPPVGGAQYAPNGQDGTVPPGSFPPPVGTRQGARPSGSVGSAGQPPSSLPVGTPVRAGTAATAAAGSGGVAGTDEDSYKEFNTKAFDAAMNGMLPLSPAQIKRLLEKMTEDQKASAAPPAPLPKAQVQAITLSLDPGAEPPVINLAEGYVTTLTLLDSTGEPWPILNVAVAGSFSVPQPEPGSHIVRITPMRRFGEGNMSLTLVGLATPLTFHLKVGGPTVSYRLDARIPKMGPGAKLPLIEKGASVVAGDDVIMAVLDGVPPSGSQRLDVKGVDNRTSAWGVNGKVFVRTPLQLLSPAWDSSVSSADGTTVYSIGPAPVLLMSDNGVLVHARISSREANNDKP